MVFNPTIQFSNFAELILVSFSCGSLGSMPRTSFAKSLSLVPFSPKSHPLSSWEEEEHHLPPLYTEHWKCKSFLGPYWHHPGEGTEAPSHSCQSQGGSSGSSLTRPHPPSRHYLWVGSRMLPYNCLILSGRGWKYRLSIHPPISSTSARRSEKPPCWCQAGGRCSGSLPGLCWHHSNRRSNLLPPCGG